MWGDGKVREPEEDEKTKRDEGKIVATNSGLSIKEGRGSARASSKRIAAIGLSRQAETWW